MIIPDDRKPTKLEKIIAIVCTEIASVSVGKQIIPDDRKLTKWETIIVMICTAIASVSVGIALGILIWQFIG